MKTNAARILESLAIPYTLQEYEVDPEDLSAIAVARKIALPAEQVFKTLLTTTGPAQHAFAAIPAAPGLDKIPLASPPAGGSWTSKKLPGPPETAKRRWSGLKSAAAHRIYPR